VLALLLISGCSKEKSEEEKMREAFEQFGKSMTEAMAKGTGPLPELKEKSDFAKDLTRKNYPKAKAPEGKQTFRWDFSKKCRFVYDFEQKIKMSSSMGMQPSMDATATLSMKSKGDKTADLVMSDISTTMMSGVKMPPVVVQGVTEDSKIPGTGGSQSEMVKLLFPLPAEPLTVGESSSVASKMPFNAYGSLLWVEGEIKVTLKGYVTIDGRICARFDVAIDISKIDVPEELPGEYKCSTKGVGVVYFDVENRCFHSGEMAVIMSVRVKPGPDSPMPVGMSMDSDNLMNFARNKEKEKEANKK
jgi:hypothetical protein